MQVIVRLLTTILPYILGYLDKHSDDILDRLYKWAGNRLGEREVATVRFNVIDESGNEITESFASFAIEIFGSVSKKSINTVISVTGFKEGTQKFIISADGYEDKEVEVTFETSYSVVEKTVVLTKEHV